MFSFTCPKVQRKTEKFWDTKKKKKEKKKPSNRHNEVGKEKVSRVACFQS